MSCTIFVRLNVVTSLSLGYYTYITLSSSKTSTLLHMVSNWYFNRVVFLLSKETFLSLKLLFLFLGPTSLIFDVGSNISIRDLTDLESVFWISFLIGVDFDGVLVVFNGVLIFEILLSLDLGLKTLLVDDEDLILETLGDPNLVPSASFPLGWDTRKLIILLWTRLVSILETDLFPRPDD